MNGITTCIIRTVLYFQRVFIYLWYNKSCISLCYLTKLFCQSKDIIKLLKWRGVCFCFCFFLFSFELPYNLVVFKAQIVTGHLETIIISCTRIISIKQVQPSDSDACPLQVQPSDSNACPLQVQPSDSNACTLQVQPSDSDACPKQVQPSDSDACPLQVQPSDSDACPLL